MVSMWLWDWGSFQWSLSEARPSLLPGGGALGYGSELPLVLR